jgi:hypothetical protein
MSGRPFEQDVIAIIWDFDKTLIPGYMQSPLFRKFGVDEQEFWAEVNNLPEYYTRQGIKLNRDIAYLNHILTYVQAGRFPGLNNALLRALGAELEFYQGLPEFFEEVRGVALEPEFKGYDVKVEHYIVSTGLAEMIRGSKVAAHMDGIWACEYIEIPAQPGYTLNSPLPDGGAVISQIAYAIDNTSKTRALFEINKGSNLFPEIDVNAGMEHEARRVPFTNMIYIADGPSDIPSFSVLKRYGGRTFAVYPPGDKQAFKQMELLRRAGRVDMYGEADYRPGTQTSTWLWEMVREIAAAIVQRKKEAVQASISKPPKHLT